MLLWQKIQKKKIKKYVGRSKQIIGVFEYLISLKKYKFGTVNPLIVNITNEQIKYDYQYLWLLYY